jgi:D-glycero-alpha-D-manno-heptose-7-phosphate kinase
MQRIVNAVAPIRICDLGGWTDTWFAGHGTVLNLGVYPYVQCQMCVNSATGARGRFTIHAENYGDRYQIDPEAVELGRHPLLEACVAAMRIPPKLDVEVNLYSQVPGGSSTGTSAAITVALVGALDVLTEGRMTPYEVARKAHEVETEHLKLQSGIQDQLAAVYGGICYIQMHQYPQASVSHIDIPNTVWWELESRLALVYLGQPHISSDVHQTVIRDLSQEGTSRQETLETLRHIPEAGRDALYAGNLHAFGRAMSANTEAQAALHPDLVSGTARKVIDVARAHGALGWKINGAGGEGGSVTLLGAASRPTHRDMLRAIEAIDPAIRVIPTYLSRYGLRVWESW